MELDCGSWPQSSRHDMICGDGHAHYRTHVHGPSSHVIFSLHCVAPEATRNRIGYQGGNSSFGQGLGLAVNTRSDGVQETSATIVLASMRTSVIICSTDAAFRPTANEYHRAENDTRSLSKVFIIAASVQNGGKKGRRTVLLHGVLRSHKTTSTSCSLTGNQIQLWLASGLDGFLWHVGATSGTTSMSAALLLA